MNSSATITSVSASKRWFMVTIIPNIIQDEIISVTGTSIIVATSLTVTNSVTFKILLSSACASNSASDCSRWASLLFLRYFAPFPLEDFPCNFSRVSLTCFWISASVGSSFLTGDGLCPPLAPLNPGLLFPDTALLFPWVGLPLEPGAPGLLTIRLRFFFASVLESFLTSGFFFLGLSNCFKSIFFPVKFGPSNFLYWVLIASELSEETSSSFDSVFKASLLASAGLSSSLETSFWASDDWPSGLISVFSFSIIGDEASLDSFSADGFTPWTFDWLSISILPTVFNSSLSALALKISSFLTSSALFFSNLASSSIRIASFSLRFSSPTSFDAAFLLASVSKPSSKTW